MMSYYNYKYWMILIACCLTPLIADAFDFERQALSLVLDSIECSEAFDKSNQYFFTGKTTGEGSCPTLIAMCVPSDDFFDCDRDLFDSIVASVRFLDMASHCNDKELKKISYFYYVYEDSAGLRVVDDSISKIQYNMIPIKLHSSLKIKGKGFNPKKSKHYLLEVNNAVHLFGNDYVLVKLLNAKKAEEWYFVVKSSASGIKLFSKRIIW